MITKPVTLKAMIRVCADLAAQDGSQLEVQRLLGVVVDGHMITLGNLCVHLRF